METYNLKVNISSDVSSFVGGLSSIGGELQGLEREVSQTVERVESSFSKLGKNLTKIGAGLTAGLTVPLTMVGKNIWDDGMEFDKQMARVKAIGQLQEEQYNRLKDQSIQVGADTVFGATDVAIAQEGMLKKGFTVDEVMVSIPGVMSLATLDDTRDVDLASSTMSSILNAYKMDKSEADRVSDIIAQGTISSALNVRDISNAMSFVGTEADSFNVSLEETTALLGILADRNIDSTRGGTTLRNVFNRLRTPVGKAGDALEELGVSAYDSSGKVRPLFEIMEDLNKAMEGMSDQQIDRYMKDIFETQAMAGARILLESLDDVKELTKVLEDSGGAAQKVSDDIMDSGSGAVEEAMGAIESANVAMFNALAPMIVEIANLIEKLADAFTNLPEPVQRALGYLGIFAWGIGPFLTSVGLAISGIEKLAGAFKWLSGGGTVAGAVGGGALATALTVVATILAVIVAGWTLTANWDKIKEKFGEITGKIGENFGEFVDRIQPNIDKLTGGFADLKDKILTDFPQLEKAIDGFSRVFEGFGTVLSGVWETIKGFLKLNFSGLLLGIVGVGGFIRGLFTGEWDGFFDAVEDISGWVHDGSWDIFGGLGTIFEGLGDIELGKGEVIIGLLDGLWTTFTDWTNTKMEELIVWVAEKMLEIWTPIEEWWTNLKESLSTWWEGIKTMVQGWYDNSIGRLITWLTDMWNEFIIWKDNVLATIQEWWNGVVEWFSNLPSAVRTHVDEFKETVSSGFKEAVDKAVEWVSGLPGRLRGYWEDMKSAGSSLVSGFISGLKSNAEGVWTSAKEMASNAVNGVKSRLNINSPSRVGVSLGGFFGEGLIGGIKGTYGDVQSASEGLANVMTGQFGNNIGGFTDGINGMIAHSVGASVNVDDFEESKQPIIIQTRFGNEDYEVYVEDITRTQDRQSWIKRR